MFQCRYRHEPKVGGPNVLKGGVRYGITRNPPRRDRWTSWNLCGLKPPTDPEKWNRGPTHPTTHTFIPGFLLRCDVRHRCRSRVPSSVVPVRVWVGLDPLPVLRTKRCGFLYTHPVRVRGCVSVWERGRGSGPTTDLTSVVLRHTHTQTHKLHIQTSHTHRNPCPSPRRVTPYYKTTLWGT